MNTLITTTEETMNHLQLAELSKKRPDSVKRTMETLAETGVISFTQIVGNPKQQGSQGGRPATEYHVNKRDSYIVMAQLSPEFTAKLVDRWQELEEKSNPMVIASTMNSAQLGLLMKETKAKEEVIVLLDKADSEVNRLQGVCNTITAQFTAGTTAPKFCKQLNGVNMQQVNNELVGMGMLRVTKEGFLPTSYARDRYFTERQEKHNGKLRAHSELTLAGAKWLYKAYLSNKLPMKKSWDGKVSHVVF